MIYPPDVTLQIVPFSKGAHPAMDSTSKALEFSSATVNLMYVEGP